GINNTKGIEEKNNHLNDNDHLFIDGHKFKKIDWRLDIMA
ncbi:hypothetical protein GASC598B02_001180, partial [Gilliamella apicola SCGC AB-598-B02]